MSISATPTRSRSGSTSRASGTWARTRPTITERIPTAVGSNMATVTVLDTTDDSTQVMAPNVTITRVELRPTPGNARMRSANRRARPCRSIA